MDESAPKLKSPAWPVAVGLVAIAILVIAGYLIWRQVRPTSNTANANAVVTNQTNTTATTNDNTNINVNSNAGSEAIVVTQPTTGANVTSPLTISGRARGSWFFEGMFPVKLLAADGSILAQGTAKAAGEWMTEEYVPFAADVSFPQPDPGTGTLVLERANPSGLPQNYQASQVLVVFPETAR